MSDTNKEGPALKPGWDLFYGNIHNLKGHSLEQCRIHKEFIDEIMKDSPGSLLEIGVGSGALALSFLDKGLKVTGVDNNLAVLSNINSRLPLLGLVDADAFNLPFQDGSFDAVYSQGVLEHYNAQDIRLLLTESLRVSRARVYFSVPNIFYRHRDFGDEHLWSKDRWDGILEGFRVIKSKDYFLRRLKRNLLLRLPIMYYGIVEK